MLRYAPDHASVSRAQSPIYDGVLTRVDKLAAAEITTAMVSAAFGATAAQEKPRDGDPFRAGDFVVYPTHGVGKIDKIGSEEIGGHKLDLIYISFDENKMTLRVPVAQARVTGLRKLASPELMAQAMTILAGRPKVSRLMWAKRAQEFQAKINSGDLKMVAEVCRDLQSAANGSAQAIASATCSNWPSIAWRGSSPVSSAPTKRMRSSS